MGSRKRVDKVLSIYYLLENISRNGIYYDQSSGHDEHRQDNYCSSRDYYIPTTGWRLGNGLSCWKYTRSKIRYQAS